MGEEALKAGLLTDRESDATTSHRMQRLFGWLCLVPLSGLIIALCRFRMRYRIKNHAEIRSKFRAISSAKTPLVVCANHLTLIDSVVIIWALASTWRYLLNYRLFCWNLPAAENARKRWSWQIITFLTKCMLIDRLGDAEHTGSVVDTVCNLLRRNNLVMLFPEGTRSRSGRIDVNAVNYGVGKILEEVPACQVLCIYQRGTGQVTYSDFPLRGEVFEFDLEVFRPVTHLTGLRGARDRSRQVIVKLKGMEERYFKHTVGSLGTQ